MKHPAPVRPSATGHRRNTLWLAAVVHRLSGLALALFLPLHFLFLGAALNGEAALQNAILWTENPLAKIAEAALVFLLGLHFLGGLRVLVIETLAWRDNQKQMAAAAATVAAVAAFIFFIRAL